jgi:phage tail-like protein
VPPKTIAAATNGAGHAPGPDPVGELRYKVEIKGLEIGRFTEVTGLQVEYEILEYGEGGNNDFTHKLRGRRKYPNLVLKRGVTNEDALLTWFLRCERSNHGHTVVLSLIGPDAKTIRRWAFDNAYPVKWQGPTFKAGSNSIATETLEIAHEGLVLS